MALTVQQRTQVWRGVMRWMSSNRSSAEFTKFELYNPANDTGMIADFDAWLENHSGNTTPDTVGINGSLNVSYRAKATPEQKTLIFCAVAAMRQGVDFVRSMFGEID